jgi:hypothetical protein
MPVPVPPPTIQPILTLSIIKEAMFEINVLNATDDIAAENAQWGLRKLQRITDKWNAIRQAIYAVTFAVFTTTPNLAPHTIGPGGNFSLAQRPVRIPAWSWIYNAGGPNQTETPMRVVDSDWWAGQPNKNLTSSVSEYLYYDPQVPLGNLNFWPIPNLANQVRLEFWTALPQAFNLDTTLTLPQGYWDALVLTLAVELCSGFDKEPSPTLVARQEIAMRIIFGNNAQPPRIRTDDGMPQSRRGGRPDYNFLTGLNDA